MISIIIYVHGEKSSNIVSLLWIKILIKSASQDNQVILNLRKASELGILTECLEHLTKHLLIHIHTYVEAHK